MIVVGDLARGRGWRGSSSESIGDADRPASPGTIDVHLVTHDAAGRGPACPAGSARVPAAAGPPAGLLGLLAAGCAAAVAGSSAARVGLPTERAVLPRHRGRRARGRAAARPSSPRSPASCCSTGSSPRPVRLHRRRAGEHRRARGVRPGRRVAGGAPSSTAPPGAPEAAPARAEAAALGPVPGRCSRGEDTAAAAGRPAPRDVRLGPWRSSSARTGRLGVPASADRRRAPAPRTPTSSSRRRRHTCSSAARPRPARPPTAACSRPSPARPRLVAGATSGCAPRPARRGARRGHRAAHRPARGRRPRPAHPARVDQGGGRRPARRGPAPRRGRPRRAGGHDRGVGRPAQRLVDNLLDLSRIADRRGHPDAAAVGLDEIVLLALAGSTPPGASGSTSPTTCRWSRADPGLLERVVANLVDNALRHGRRRPVVVRGSAHADRVELRVVDAGPACPAARETDVRAVPAPRRPGRARGLGLGLARRPRASPRPWAAR